jgi:hypothetical protein
MASRTGRGSNTGAKKRGKSDAASMREMSRGNGNVKKRKPESFEDLFGGGDSGNLLHPDFDREDVYAWFQNRHAKGTKVIGDDGVYRTGEHEWPVPYGVRIALRTRLTYNQIVVKYPFTATWTSPKSGRRLKKNFTSLIGAIKFCTTKAQYVDPQCSIIARVVGYDVPPKLRGKLPRRMRGSKMHYWCPYCMDARRFKRGEGEFYAMKKFWNDEKQRWDWKEVKLAILICTVCGISNRDSKFRRSNQPFEVRKIKQGVRWVKRRKK